MKFQMQVLFNLKELNMNTSFAFVVLVGEDPNKKFVKRYIGPSTHEVLLSGVQDARKHAPSVAVSIADYMQQAVHAGRPVPQLWLTAQAQYEDGSPVPGTPAIPYVAPPKSKAPAISELPEIPPAVQLADGTWRQVPAMQLKYSQHGTYYAVPYAFIYKGSPMSGNFAAPTRKELLDAIFDPRNDARPDGRGGWLDPHNPQVPGEPTREQIYRSNLPEASIEIIEGYLSVVRARDAAIAAAEAELYREPSEQEVQAVDVSDARIHRMPAAVLRDLILSSKAFARAYERREKALAAFAVKEAHERETEQANLAAKQARERLANRENPVNSEALERKQKAERESLMRPGR
jgi:hypothetical protein